MAKTLGAIVLFLGTVFSCFPAEAVVIEAFDYIRWGQEERLRVAISETAYLLKNRPLQIGNGENKSQALRRTGIEGQYRFAEIPEEWKLEGFLNLGLYTREDIWDELDAAAGLGLTYQNYLRFDFGARNVVNIGAKNEQWGGRQYWFGVCGKIFEASKILFDTCGRYYFVSNISAKNAAVQDEKNPLSVDLAVRALYYPIEELALSLILAAPFDKDTEAHGVKVSPSVEYFIGKHVYFVPKGISLVSGGEFGNAGHTIFFTLKWEFK